LRVETMPGEQAQVDWGSVTDNRTSVGRGSIVIQIGCIDERLRV
jgi:hypothetical protein